MTKEEEAKMKKMESALKVIQTWAEYYHDRFWAFPHTLQMDNLKDIAKKCKEALKEKDG